MSKSRLIVVEGIPGSGKTSMAGFIQRWLDEEHIPNRLYQEGDLDHPADFESVAHFTRWEFESLLLRHPHFRALLERYVETRGDDCFLGYRKIQLPGGGDLPAELFAELAQHDVYETPVPETYCRLALERWQSFAGRAIRGEQTFIFDCCLLQNPLAVLIIKHNRSVAEAVGHIRNVLAAIAPLEPSLVYLQQQHPQAVLQRMAAERPQEWRDYVSAYTDRGRWSQASGVYGFAGFIAYHELRQAIELDLFHQLEISRLLVDTSAYDWGESQQEVAAFLSQTLKV